MSEFLDQETLLALLNQNVLASIFLSRAFFSSSDFRRLNTVEPLTACVKSGIANGVLAAEFTGRYPGFSLARNADDLLVENASSWECPHIADEDITYIEVN